MKQHFYRLYILPVIAALLACVAAAQTLPSNAAHGATGTSKNPAVPSDPAYVAAFTENRGQIADTRGEARPEILYSLQEGMNASLYFQRNRISHVFARIEAYEGKSHAPAGHEGHDHDEAPNCVTGLYRMDMELVGSNPQATVDASDILPSYSNYYLGHCPDGILNVRSYRTLTYHDIYPNIDMVLRSVEGGVKCDFVVRPGGKVSDIRLRYVAADDVMLEDNGGMKATTPLGFIAEDAPYSYQTVGTSRQEIESSYRIDGDMVAFEVGEYDQTKTLVIDPYRKWATYYGGSGTESLIGGDPSEVDRSGNVLVTGYVSGTGFPTSTGAFQTSTGGNNDAFVVKFSSAGNRLWATYYGGNSDDIAHGIVSAEGRNVFIAGHTTSSNLPTGALTGNSVFQSSLGGNRDAFVVKFDSNGTRQWGTYYGGSNWDDGYGFAADSGGNIAVFITTGSSGMGTSGTFQSTKPSTAGNNGSNYDILIAKMTGTGSRAWATYYGGSDEEYGYAGGSDNHQNILFTGWTYSNDFPVSSSAHQSSRSGSSDAFVVKLAVDGTRRWATYYGGSGRENDDATSVGYCGLATDGADNVFISGLTTGSFPVTSGAMQGTYGGGSSDGFAVKFDSSGTRQWATYIGGSGIDIASGIASNAVGGVLVTGRTNSSTGFPVTTTTYQGTIAGSYDAFITKLSSTGTNVWSTYYGGTGADYGEGVSFDPYGSVFMVGSTSSNNFPVLQPYQQNNGGSSDAFVVLFCDIDPGVIDTSRNPNLCQGDSVILSVAHGYATVQWYSNTTGGVISTADSIVVKQTGRFWARLTNGAGCEAYTDTITVNVYPKPAPVITGQLQICQGDTTTLDAGAGFASYRWTNGATTQKIKVTQAGYFNVYVTNANGCSDSARGVTVEVRPRPDSVWIVPPGPHKFCDGESVTLTATGSTGSYLWSSGERSQSITVTKAGTYTVTISNQYGCTFKSNPVTVSLFDKPNVQIYASGPTTICEGDSVILSATPGFKRYTWSTGDTTLLIKVKESGTYNVTVVDDNGCRGTAMMGITVVSPPKPVIARLGSTSFCQGDSVILDAGNSYKSYVWSTGETTQRIIVKTSGRYSVSVVDLVGCKGNSDTVTVEVKPRPKATLNGPSEVCANSIGQYSVPADTGVTWSWSVTGGGGSITSGQGTASINVQWGANGSGVVRVTVTSKANGCTALAELKVTIGSKLVPTITPDRSLNLCEGDSVTLDAGVYSTYLWSTGETKRKIVVRQPGVYTVTVSEGSCSGTSQPVTVTQSAPPVPVITAAKKAICPGETVELDAGGPYDSYRWSTGQTVRKITVSAAGNYTVTVVDANGCTGTSEAFPVTIHPLPTPQISGPNSVCLNATGTYSVTATSGNVYTWSVTGAGGTIISGQGTPVATIRWASSGTGVVTVDEFSAATGCTGKSPQYLVAVGTSLTPKITVLGSTTLCEGDSVTLSAPSGYSSYSWSNGMTTQQILVKTEGRYRVTVVDDGGCSGSDSVDITIKQLPFPFITPGGPVGLCPGDSVVLTAAPGYKSYLWSNGEATSAITVKEAGEYSVTATNEDGCRGRSEIVTVVANPAPPKPVITVYGDTLESSPATTYQWYYEGTIIPGARGQRYVATKPGNHTVEITDGNGCSALSDPADGVKADAVIELGEYEAIPGQKLTIPINLVGSHNLDNVGLNNYTMTVRFFRNVLYPAGSTEMGDTVEAFRIVKITGSRGTTINGSIGQIELVAALGDTLESPLRIDNFQWTDGDGTVRTMDGWVRVKPQGGWKLYIPDGRLTLLPPRPNPTTGPTEIIYEVIEPGRTQLFMVNMLGQRMVNLLDAEILPGRYSLQFDPNGVSSGAYFIVLETPTGRLAQPMQVQH